MKKPRMPKSMPHLRFSCPMRVKHGLMDGTIKELMSCDSVQLQTSQGLLCAENPRITLTPPTSALPGLPWNPLLREETWDPVLHPFQVQLSFQSILCTDSPEIAHAQAHFSSHHLTRATPALVPQDHQTTPVKLQSASQSHQAYWSTQAITIHKTTSSR